MDKGSRCKALFKSEAAEEISDVVDTAKSKTQKKRDIVQEKVGNSKLILQKTTYGASYAMANTIN